MSIDHRSISNEKLTQKLAVKKEVVYNCRQCQLIVGQKPTTCQLVNPIAWQLYDLPTMPKGRMTARRVDNFECNNSQTHQKLKQTIENFKVDSIIWAFCTNVVFEQTLYKQKIWVRKFPCKKLAFTSSRLSRRESRFHTDKILRENLHTIRFSIYEKPRKFQKFVTTLVTIRVSPKNWAGHF